MNAYLLKEFTFAPLDCLRSELCNDSQRLGGTRHEDRRHPGATGTQTISKEQTLKARQEAGTFTPRKWDQESADQTSNSSRHEGRLSLEHQVTKNK